MVYPNAGLPNELGEYDERPEQTAALVARMGRATAWSTSSAAAAAPRPAHIAAIAEAVARPARRARCRSARRDTRLAGLEPLVHRRLTWQASERRRDPGRRAGARFVNIGERTNVTGSAKFKKLILAGDYDAAVEVARQQVENGAQIIDVNMDEGLLDARAAMTTFLKLIAAEPDIARVPVMIDSSKWR